MAEYKGYHITVARDSVFAGTKYGVLLVLKGWHFTGSKDGILQVVGMAYYLY